MQTEEKKKIAAGISIIIIMRLLQYEKLMPSKRTIHILCKILQSYLLAPK